MKEVIHSIDSWLAAGETDIALATVINTWGSAPRKVGAKMVFTAGGAAVAGSVSGGCVEGAVIEAGEEVLLTGRPALLHFGVADDTAWSVGLACGGTIDVLVEPLNVSIHAATRDTIMANKPVTILTVIDGDKALLGCKVAVAGGEIVAGSLGEALDHWAVELARQARQSTRHQLEEGPELFIDAMRPSPTLAIVGGGHIAVILVEMAKMLNYRTVVIDPRRAFASEERFPNVDELLQMWPEKAFAAEPIAADTAIVTLSHDPKIDDPALRAALNSDAFYIGSLGSRSTNAKRRERLVNMGFSDEQLARLHAPVGLAIGADNPEEIALAIMAEIVATYRGRKL